MTLAEVFPGAQQLTASEKLKLIRILAEDLDSSPTLLQILLMPKRLSGFKRVSLHWMQFGIMTRMMFMLSYSKNDIILVRYPFSDLSSAKVRPAVVVNAPHRSQDLFITPLTIKIGSLLAGEFVLSEWSTAGLNVVSNSKFENHLAENVVIAHTALG
jgi:hypothetical protein